MMRPDRQIPPQRQDHSMISSLTGTTERAPHRPFSTFMLRRIFMIAIVVFAALASSGPVSAEPLRIGYQKSSTLTAILKTNGELEKALAPLGVTISWHEFSSGLPLLEAINIGSIDFGADVADTVPIFAQAAGAKLAYVAEEAASPAAQAIVVPQSSTIKTIAELKGKKIAVTKGAGSHYLLLAALAKSGLNFKDITPAYLTPADGRAAFVSNNVDAWVAWDPFLTSALHQTKGRILTDGSNGLASYKRYYLASAAYADKHAEVLNVIFAKLSQTGKWVKARRRTRPHCSPGSGVSTPRPSKRPTATAP